MTTGGGITTKSRSESSSDFKFTATIFLSTRGIERDPRFLTWKQVREMADAGITFGGHTCTHPDLTRLNPGQAYEEISGCRKQIEDRLVFPSMASAIPTCPQRLRIEDMVLRAGFRFACLTDPASAEPTGVLPTIRRAGIYATTTPLLFRMKLSPLGNRCIDACDR